MPLRFLLDEHLRGGALWQAILQHNSGGINSLDVTRVGDPADLPLGSLDPDILIWAEREQRILISLDKRTLTGHLQSHFAAGHHSAGVLIIRPGSTLPAVLYALALVAHAGDAADYRDQIVFIP